MSSRRKIMAWMAAALLCVAILPVSGARAEYPEKTIRFVVPFPAGGSTDIAARIIAEGLSKRLGQTVVVDNQPGANGLIGASTVVRAKPDGYTLLVTSNGLHSAAATGTANFDLKTDLVPISQVVGGSLIIVSSKQAPFDTAQGFIDYAKKNGDHPVTVAINAALGGAHLAFESFRRAVGIDYKPIFYAGESPSLAALVSGESMVGIVSSPAARPFVESGKVNAIAVTVDQRYGGLPDVPTLAETVAPNFSEGYSTVMFAPKGTPAEIVDHVAKEVAELVKDPAMQARLTDLGLTPIGSTPAEYGALVSAEFDRNGKLIKELREAGLAE